MVGDEEAEVDRSIGVLSWLFLPNGLSRKLSTSLDSCSMKSMRGKKVSTTESIRL